MPRRIVEAGRMDVKGADVRFKAKGTLEAYDRNLAALAKVRVRSTPAPGAKLFADFEFAEEVFRVFQDVTLVNYKEFLPQVAFSGIDNFRAMVRHTSQAFVDGAHDAATKEFGNGKPPERFMSAEEFGEYNEAVMMGSTPNVAPLRVAMPVTPSQREGEPEIGATENSGPPAGTADGGKAMQPKPAAATADEAAKKRAAEEAWKKFAPEIEKAAAERGKKPRTGGWVLIVMGLLTLAASLATLMQTRNLPENAPNVYPLLALGMLLGIAFVAAGVLFLRPIE